MIEARLALRRGDFALDVDLRLPALGVCALFGPSGSGKTTVLRALAGLERAAGRVALGDEVWQDDSAGIFVPTHRRAIGYVLQEAALFPHLDVQRNLAYGQARTAAALRRIALDQAVDLLGIAGLMARRPATLSGGERVRASPQASGVPSSSKRMVVSAASSAVRRTVVQSAAVIGALVASARQVP